MFPANTVTFEKEDHIYRNERNEVIPSVTQLIKYFGLSNYDMIRGDVLEASLNFGSVVHETCALYDKDALANYDSQVDPHLEQWKKYRKDQNIDKFDLVEEPLYSRIWRFAGTPDRLHGKTILEIKTGQEAVWHRIQTGLYKILIEENYKIKVLKRKVVYLQENKYQVVEHKDRTDLSIAKSLIQIYNFKRLHKIGDQ